MASAPEQWREKLEQAFSSRTPRLDLGRTGLTYLPPELMKMDWLEELILGNDDTIYPGYEGAGTCTRNTGIDNVLDLKELLYKLRSLPRLKMLALHDLKLGVFPDLGFLPELEILDLDGNGISVLGERLSTFPKLKKLYLGNNNLTSVDGIANLVSLESLHLNLNQLTNIDKLHQLTNLNELVLVGNAMCAMKDLPTTLETIDLSENRISSLKDFNFTGLSRLSKLNLFINNISSIEHDLDQLPALTDLNLSYNKLENMLGLEGLTSLRHLNLSTNYISEIKGLEKLTQLRTLNLYKNNISSCAGLENLHNLETLDLSYNEISSLDEFPTNLELDTLSLSNNKLLSIDPLEPLLDKLSWLDVSGNQLADLDTSILKTKNNLEAVRNFYAVKKSANEKVPNDIVKMILAGNSGAGKTNFFHALEKNQYNDMSASTHGILCETYTVGPGLKAVVWDFGGQEYYHATHHLFFKNYAVYVLLWEKLTNKNTEILNERTQELIQHYDYLHWLGSIHHYANENPEVLVLQNKIDMVHPTDETKDNSRQRVEFDSSAGYSISHDFYMSLKAAFDPCKQEKFVATLSAIKHHLNEILQRTAGRFEILKIEQELRDKVQALFEGKLSVTKAVFAEACIKAQPKIREYMDHFVDYLDGIGYILYYKNSTLLQDKIFVNPIGITALIYDILDKEKVLSQKGCFDIDWVRQVRTNDKWKDYEIDEDDIISLMKEFEIIFEKQKEDGKTLYIAPQYLSKEEPYKELFDIVTEDLVVPSFTLHFPFYFTNSLLYRFIIRHADKSIKNIYWKYGFLYSDGDNRILVKTRPDKKKVEVFIKSNEPNRRSTRNIRQELFVELIGLYFNKTFTLDTASTTNRNDELVKHRGEPLDFSKNEFRRVEISVDAKNFIELSQLNEAGREESEKVRSRQGNFVWLADFNDFNNRPVKQPLNIFVSYSHKDTELKEKLQSHLSSLIRSNRVKAWTDHLINPGDQWDEAILSNLRKADIILLLISADFLNSQYIWEKELSVAFEKLNKKESIVVPVYLRDCDFEALSNKNKETIELVATDLYKLQFTPVDTVKNKLISVSDTREWGNHDIPLNIVAKKLREIIDKK